MNCGCHGEPAYWQKDVRLTTGGWWECAVKRRAHNATRASNDARRDGICQRRRDKYDTDPVFRIGGNLKKNARRRADRLRKRREALYGSV